MNNKELLEQIDCDGVTPLHLAIIFDRTEIATYLVSEGANCFARTPEAMTDKYKKPCYSTNANALDLAREYKRESIVFDLLVKKYILPTIEDASLSADIIKMIYRYPMFINRKDNLNQALLLWAASRGKGATVSFLMEQGADINPCTQSSNFKEDKRTALDSAIVGEHADIASMLAHDCARHGGLGLFNPRKFNLGTMIDNNIDPADLSGTPLKERQDRLNHV